MRYVTQRNQPARLWWEELPAVADLPPPATLTVHDVGPIDTGLVDENGNKIMRLPDPIGFPIKSA